jgi:glycosyltransferase involved in cell wall biosynthesis
MRILVFTTVFPNAAHPLHGLFVAERTRHASEHAQITVVAPVPWFFRRPAALETLRGIGPIEHPRFFYVPGLFKALDGLLLFLSALPTVWRLRRHFDFDLIDAHFGFPDGVAAVLLAAWFRRPVVVTLRGSELEMSRYKMRRAALGWALRRADRVIAVSKELAGLATSMGVHPGRIRVIGNGVDAERFRPLDRATARRSLGVPDAATLIVSVGHLARVKGFELVLQALSGIAVVHKAVRFVIVGGPAPSSGSYPAQLTAEIARLGAADRVTITGPVAPEQVALWLSAADVFVLASEREGSPNALREALACGCPVVACDVGDAREMLGAEAGRIVADRACPDQWRDAVLAALGTSWDRAAIRAGAERHTWADVATRVASEWRTCAEAHASGAAACDAATRLR